METFEVLFLILIIFMIVAGFIAGLLVGLCWSVPELTEVDSNKEIENDEKN